MRILIANCSAVYDGRGSTVLNPAVRAIITKKDGSVSIHHDAGNKALNYMGKTKLISHPPEHTDEGIILRFENDKEHLIITMHEVISDSDHELDDQEELLRDGTEKHLQEWIVENPVQALGEGWEIVEREFQTGSGPVDILARDPEGGLVAVEVKRVAMSDAVKQVGSYVKSLAEMEGFEEVRGVVAALSIRPKTYELAKKRGVECIEIDALWREKRKCANAESTA